MNEDYFGAQPLSIHRHFLANMSTKGCYRDDPQNSGLNNVVPKPLLSTCMFIASLCTLKFSRGSSLHVLWV